jgi:LysR family glycine cleavage system transcriptional activator
LASLRNDIFTIGHKASIEKRKELAELVSSVHHSRVRAPHLPLRSLIAFEAAARLGSFREASEELGLTPSAISHQVRLLEAGFGIRLFERIGRGVFLSQEGQRLYDQVHDGFERLRGALSGLKGKENYVRARDVVRVSTPPSLASQWLLPRLSGFLAEHPGIDIRVNAQNQSGLHAPDIDLAVVYGSKAKWATRAVPLLAETVEPYCAPALLEARKARRPHDLLAHTLIRTRGNGVSWEEWLRRHDVRFERLKTIQLDPSHVAIEAAARGLGIVLESNVLTEDEVVSGKLVAPLSGFGISATSYWLLTLREPGSRNSVDIAKAWLLELAAKDRP